MADFPSTPPSKAPPQPPLATQKSATDDIAPSRAPASPNHRPQTPDRKPIPPKKPEVGPEQSTPPAKPLPTP